MNDRSGNLGNWVLNLLLLAAGSIAVVYALRLGLGNPGQPGAGLFPFIAGVAMLAADAVLIVASLRAKAAPAEFPFDANAFARIAALIAVMAGWVLAMPYLGYVVVTFAGVCALARLFGLRGWRQPLLLAAFTALTVYVMFDWLLFLDLPRGIFAPRD
jgi:putative tricarboxylic transport membrane protein